MKEIVNENYNAEGVKETLWIKVELRELKLAPQEEDDDNDHLLDDEEEEEEQREIICIGWFFNCDNRLFL